MAVLSLCVPWVRRLLTPDLNDYALFVEVVTYGGFAAAGRALRAPKSTLSRRIAGLEARLGVRLIERSTRRFRVTEVGQAFYERCRMIVMDVQQADAVVSETLWHECLAPQQPQLEGVGSKSACKFGVVRRDLLGGMHGGQANDAFLHVDHYEGGILFELRNWHRIPLREQWVLAVTRTWNGPIEQRADEERGAYHAHHDCQLV